MYSHLTLAVAEPMHYESDARLVMKLCLVMYEIQLGLMFSQSTAE